jgi:hypothetical protein
LSRSKNLIFGLAVAE